MMFKEKTRCAATTSRVSDATRKELIQSVGIEGFVLFHYYVGKQNIKNFLFTDESAARALSIPVRKIATIRRNLIKASWFIQYNEYFDQMTQEYVIRTILGRDNIHKHLKSKPSREDNLNEMFPIR